jgi:hypothetical protein
MTDKPERGMLAVPLAVSGSGERLRQDCPADHLIGKIGL